MKTKKVIKYHVWYSTPRMKKSTAKSFKTKKEALDFIKDKKLQKPWYSLRKY